MSFLQTGAAVAASALAPAAALPEQPVPIVVTGRAPRADAGRTITTVPGDAFQATPATSIADVVRLSPGVVSLQGNGPRDAGVSIRGSNARSGFGARNIQVFEDGFPVTQPDGLARFDLADPHAYGGVDVVRGPSSARYGNYALAGALDFRTRRGAEIDGLETGTDLGGDGYANLHAVLGGAGRDHDYSLFGSYVRGQGATGHTGYETATLNAHGTYSPGSADRLTAKLIHNRGEFRLSTRLSFDQYAANPYQQGCARAASAAPGCGTIAVFVNGTNGARIRQTAAEADLARDDRRTIAGVRYERDLDPATIWRTQATFDSRVVYQPTSATPFRGTFRSWNLSSDIVRDTPVLGVDATRTAGLFFNTLDSRSFSFNKTPAGRDGYGAPTQTVVGRIDNAGARAAQTLRFAGGWQATAGIGGEWSRIDVRQTGYTYPVGGAPAVRDIPAERTFWNVAPEASLGWTLSDAIRLHARIAAGYGIPQAGNLFVTADGAPGNNADLKPQRTTGIDLGARVAVHAGLSFEITGYHEWFRNELVSQSAGIDRLAYTANVPASVHRGVEIGVDWAPGPAALPGMRVEARYTYNDHRYTRYAERLTAGPATALIDRDGRRIPGVVPSAANLRLVHDDPATGYGGFVEVSRRGRFAIDNANLLEVPAATLVNLNLGYRPRPERGGRAPFTLFAAVQNLFDRTHVAAASVIASSLDPVTARESDAEVLRTVTGSLYAGAPRTIYVGIATRFR